MGRLRQLRSSRFLILQFLLVAIIFTPVLSHCKIGNCSSQYYHSVELRQVARGPTFAYCTVLKKYQECIQAIARHCRGNLEYHSISSLVQSWKLDFNCTQILSQGPPPEPGPLPSEQPCKNKRDRCKVPDVGSVNHPEECSYRGTGALTSDHSQQFKFCGLFGDPHLRTFYNEFQTCRAVGAWPLIDNPYMAVQITNDPLSADTSATATSKVTVIIRGHGACTGEKTYEATGSEPLPGTFVDGSRAGGASVRLREEFVGKHVEITVRHANARIVIRQVGRYLTFAVRMPSEVATLGAHGESLELCVRGCPRREQLTDTFSLAHTDTRRHSSGLAEARATCRRHNVTDPYLDVCVFDLLTTGDASFAQAAHHAMTDARVLGAPPHNRTEKRLVTDFESSSGLRTSISNFVLLLIVALMRLFTR